MRDLVHDSDLKYGTIFGPLRFGHDMTMSTDQLLEEAEERSRRLEPDDIMLTTYEVGEALRISAKQIENLMRQGKVPGMKVGGRWRCSRKALREFMAHDG